MRASSDMQLTAPRPQWTPGWVVMISFLTPASAWALHTVMPDMVAWYLGVMGWLVLTPDSRPSWLKGPRLHESLSTTTAHESVAMSQPSVTNASADTPEAQKADPATTGDGAATTKARKPRSKARKPKAVTLAEVKALTGGGDRAVVWSQVGPGKFVRQPGDENAETASESDGVGSETPGYSNTVIEAVVTGSTILEHDDDDDSADDDDPADRS